MLDVIVEIILDIVLEGVIEAAGSRKVPMPVRIILAGMILLLMLTVVALVFWAGAIRQSVILVLIAAAMLIGLAYLCFAKVRQFKRKC